MYFEVADITLAVWIPPLVGFAIALFTSMGGVSGAFLLLPFQVSVLGFATPAVSATNQVFNVVATPSGVYRYLREGRMVWPLAWIIAAGTLPGVVIGGLLRIVWLPEARDFKLFVAAVLIYIAVRLGRDVFSASVAAPRRGAHGRVTPIVTDRTRLAYRYGGTEFGASRTALFALAVGVGVIGGAYGIGGGAIIAPLLVSVFALPVYTVAGAALLATLITAVAAVGFYQLIGPLFPGTAVAPDWPLGLLFGLGGAVGMYLGARLQRHVPARALKLLLVFCLLAPAVVYLVEFLTGRA